MAKTDFNKNYMKHHSQINWSQLVWGIPMTALYLILPDGTTALMSGNVSYAYTPVTFTAKLLRCAAFHFLEKRYQLLLIQSGLKGDHLERSEKNFKKNTGYFTGLPMLMLSDVLFYGGIYGEDCSTATTLASMVAFNLASYPF